MAQFISVEIIRKYLAGNSTQEETEAVLDWFGSHDLFPEELAGLSPQEYEQLKGKLFERIMVNVATAEAADDESNGIAVLKPLYKWVSVAAVVLTVLSVTLYLLIPRQPHSLQKLAKVTAHTANGAKITGMQANKAVLVLANGKTVNLTDAHIGAIGNQGKTMVVKTNNGQIAYQPSSINNETVTYNELTTPKGSKYELVLPDGTMVCLNAASTLRFPTAFNGTERNVELKGEGYFEVSKDAHRPFNVIMNGVTVQVLGTHFDISAYDNDSFIKTTLLEGSVKVSKNGITKMLTPGNQAVIEASSDRISISKANVDNAVGWRNGFFIFEHENIAEIMKKVARWYDVEIVTKGVINTDQHFSGRFDRSKAINELLDYLEKLDAAHFIIEGRRITMVN